MLQCVLLSLCSLSGTRDISKVAAGIGYVIKYTNFYNLSQKRCPIFIGKIVCQRLLSDQFFQSYLDLVIHNELAEHILEIVDALLDRNGGRRVGGVVLFILSGLGAQSGYNMFYDRVFG